MWLPSVVSFKDRGFGYVETSLLLCWTFYEYGILGYELAVGDEVVYRGDKPEAFTVLMDSRGNILLLEPYRYFGQRQSKMRVRVIHPETSQDRNGHNYSEKVDVCCRPCSSHNTD